MKILCCVLLGLACAGPASAAVYRCRVKGLTVFSDTPCGAGAVRLPIDTPPAARSAGSEGLRPGERRWLKRARKADAAAAKARDRQFDRDVAREEALEAECAKLREKLAQAEASRSKRGYADGLRERFNALRCGAH